MGVAVPSRRHVRASIPIPSTNRNSISTAASAIFAGSRFVDGQRPAFVLLLVQPGNCRLRFLVGAHFHEPKAFTASRFSILNHLGTSNRAELGKHLLEL